MTEKMMIPFGPQHPALTTPVQFDIVMEGERVLEAIPSMGYVHRGLEKMVDNSGHQEMINIAERISARDSFGHGWAACAAIEGAMGIEIPERAAYLRTVLHELERIQSHLLWLGQMADILGTDTVAVNLWKAREGVLDVFKQTTGNRIIHSICKVGGVKRDISADELRYMLEILKDTEEDSETVTEAFLDNRSIRKRLSGIGVISMDDAEDLCAVGPAARASGILQDVRLKGNYGVYPKLGFEPCVAEEGDCYARCRVRVDEIFQSIELVREAISIMPEGPVDIPVDDDPEDCSPFVFRLEQPGGEECCYAAVNGYAAGNGTKSLTGIRTRVPGNANIPAMIRVLQDCDLADLPLLVHSFDPDFYGTER